MLDPDVAVALVAFGAAATSARASRAALHVRRRDGSTIREAPMAVVDARTLVEQLSVTAGPVASEAIASQAAAASGGLVVEAFEVVR